MKRAYKSSAIQSKPDPSKLVSEGFPTNGDPVNSVPPTQPGAEWFYLTTEEMVSLVEEAGLSPANEPQLVPAIKTIITNILKTSDLFVTIAGEGEQEIEQSKKFLAIIHGVSPSQSADLAADSTVIPTVKTIHDLAVLKTAAVAYKDQANTFTATQLVRAALTVTKSAGTAFTVNGTSALNGPVAVTGNASITGTLAVTGKTTLGEVTAGAATFSAPVTCTAAPTADGHFTNKHYVDTEISTAISGAERNDLVDIGSAQTIKGAKTFTLPITGNLNGNAQTATALASAITITLEGAITGTATTDGSSNVTLSTKAGAGGGGSVPTGSIIPFMGQGGVPEGYLLCNGATVSRTTYAALFAAIGTKFGSGNGSSTFTLPNLNGRYLQGTTSTPGSAISAGLPNITGTCGYNEGGGVLSSDGTFYSGAFSTGSSCSRTLGGWNHKGYYLSISASRSNSLYGSASTVQPKSYGTQYLIKY